MINFIINSHIFQNIKILKNESNQIDSFKKNI
jgi:hypothetical protein